MSLNTSSVVLLFDCYVVENNVCIYGHSTRPQWRIGFLFVHMVHILSEVD